MISVDRGDNSVSRGDSFTFDGASNLLRGDEVENATLGVQVLRAVSTLRFGWFGGWFVKIAYVILGAGLTIITTSGVAIWLAHRRDKGRPAPIWERVWIATVCTQPLAFAVAALGSIAFGA